jgi:ribose transport system permease protein
MIDADTEMEWSWLQRLKTGSTPSQLIMMVLLVSVTVYLCIKSPYFLTWGNIRNILDHSALNAIIAVGMTFVICAAGIDLSVGAIAALCGVVMALAMHGGLSWRIVIPSGIVAGFLLGGINGLVISLFKVNPFIVTLATMSIMRGLALILTGGIPIYNFSNGFTWWGSGHIGPINPPMLLALLAIFGGAVMLNWTRFGYYALSIGGNEEALRRTGVNTVLCKTLVYGFCGLMAAIGGLIITARLNTAEPLAGTMIELEAIATVVLGGTAMNGGKGTIFGTVLASLLLGVLRNGLVILSIPSYYQQLLIGLIILSAVVVTEMEPR